MSAGKDFISGIRMETFGITAETWQKIIGMCN